MVSSSSSSSPSSGLTTTTTSPSLTMNDHFSLTVSATCNQLDLSTSITSNDTTGSTTTASTTASTTTTATGSITISDGNDTVQLHSFLVQIVQSGDEIYNHYTHHSRGSDYEVQNDCTCTSKLTENIKSHKQCYQFYFNAAHHAISIIQQLQQLRPREHQQRHCTDNQQQKQHPLHLYTSLIHDALHRAYIAIIILGAFQTHHYPTTSATTNKTSRGTCNTCSTMDSYDQRDDDLHLQSSIEYDDSCYNRNNFQNDTNNNNNNNEEYANYQQAVWIMRKCFKSIIQHIQDDQLRQQQQQQQQQHDQPIQTITSSTNKYLESMNTTTIAASTLCVSTTRNNCIRSEMPPFKHHHNDDSYLNTRSTNDEQQQHAQNCKRKVYCSITIILPNWLLVSTSNILSQVMIKQLFSNPRPMYHANYRYNDNNSFSASLVSNSVIRCVLQSTSSLILSSLTYYVTSESLSFKQNI